MSQPLTPFRKKIDDIDDNILDLLEQRFAIVREVGQIKAQQNIEIIQSDRAEEVLQRVTNQAQQKNIPAELMQRFYTDMIDHAHTIEFAIKAKEQEKTHA